MPGPLVPRWRAVEHAAIEAGSLAELRVEADNAGTAPWRTRGHEDGLFLSYHWLDERGNPIVWDGPRTVLERVVAPGETLRQTMHVRGPIPPGRYRLAIDLVEEHRFWVAELGVPAWEETVDVLPRSGGAQVFESQSACPVQAFARFRLRADAWDACPEGLSARERGIVLHAVLKAFWDDVRDHATLDAIDAAGLARRIAAAVDSGKAKLAPARWRALPPAIATAESQRLRVTIAAWLDEAERGRPPFRVRSHEQSLACDVEGLGVRVRIDRIDELDGGGIAIIDYKSGRVFKPARWFAPRPQGIQLAVYAHGVECTEDSPVRALAYAQVRAGDVAVSGIADTHDAWPALDVPGEDGRVPARTWDEARQQLRARLVTLANGIRGGDARVAPRDGATCQYCALKPLCRIQVLDDAADSRAASDA